MQDLSLSVLDIAQNSISADARLIEISIRECSVDKTLSLCISDDGTGMTPEQARLAAETYYTAKNGEYSGHGLPLLKESAEKTGGRFEISSAPQSGTAVSCLFCTDSADMMPFGDMDATAAVLICCNPDVGFIYTRSLDGKSYSLDSRHMSGILDGCLTQGDAVKRIREFLTEQENILHGGAISNENT